MILHTIDKGWYLILYFHTKRIIYGGVDITKNASGIAVTFPYNPLLIEKIKTISYHTWDSEKKILEFLKYRWDKRSF
jgi:hypothetical protein